MKIRPLSLIEVLQPRAFCNTPERARVTRTIVQPEIDAFEQMEAGSPQGKSALGGRRPTDIASQLAGV
jgi:hypothetical protein